MDPVRNDPNKNNPGQQPENGKPKSGGWFTLTILLLIALAVSSIFNTVSESQYDEKNWTDFRAEMTAGTLHEVEIDNDKIVYLTKEEAAKPAKEQRACYARIPGTLDLIPLANELADMGVSVKQKQSQDYIAAVLMTLLSVLPFIFLFRMMSKRMGGDAMGGFGKSKAKVYMEKETGIRFTDVAGQDEAKESLQEIIDFLHNPGKYTEIGAKLPKGALLVGPPGTGKTLLAKAVAGEGNVPFFYISGSDFEETFVGVGSSRVRDMFQQAAKVAPCIIFIDEIDGFDSNKGIVVLAATNRPEILDKALLRPGRFDRRIIVDKPNLQGRLETLKVHTRKIRLSEDVDLNKIAHQTAGAVGADLANLVNEAALRAVRQGRMAVNQEDLLVSYEVVIAGTEKKNSVLSEMEKRLVSYHEVGHALVSALQKDASPVTKITIVPSTMGSLGYTLYLPEEEKHLHTRDELLVELRSLLGGRAAEEIVFGTVTAGAAGDIQQATGLARNMVALYGMSEELGLMAAASVGSRYLDGGAHMDCSNETAALVDNAVKRMLTEAYADAKQLLSDNRALLDEVAQYLLLKETITGEELMSFVNAPKADPTEEPAEESAE